MNAPKITDYTLEQYLLGELPPERMRDVRAAAEEQPILAARIRALKESNAQILKEVPPAEFARRVEAQRMGDAQRSRRRVMTWSAPVLMAAALVLVVSSGGLFSPAKVTSGEFGPDTVRTKGGDAHGLSAFLITETGPQKLKDGQRVAAGDQIQLAYVAYQSGYGAVFSVDGNQVVTQHLPARGKRAAPLQVGQRANVPSSYVLDDAPKFERFFFIAAQENFDLAEVRPMLESVGRDQPMGLDDRFTVSELLLEKGL